MNKRVSVIIPAYNAAAFLQRTVECAAKQTYKNLEIIIVDDGSTDDTAVIARHCAEKFDNIKYYYKKNGGVASARNYGIEIAQGYYVAFLDADDLWHPSKIASQVSALEQSGENVAACFSLHRIIDTDDRVLQPGWFWPAIDFSFAPHIVIHPVGNGSSILVNRAVAIEVGGYEEEYARLQAGGCEDLDFELKVAAKYKIRCVPAYHVGYRRYEGNMSSDRTRMVRAFNMVIERHLARNPHLPAFCRDLALSMAYEFSLERMASQRQFKACLKYAYKLLKANPSALGKFVLDRWPRALVRRLTRPISRRLGYAPLPKTWPSFLSIEPTELSFDGLWTANRALYERLAAVNSLGVSTTIQKSSRASGDIAKLGRAG